jgi:phage baseplate assembly protein V
MDSLDRYDKRRQEHLIRSLVQRGTVSSVDASRKMQTMDLRLRSGHRPSQVEHWEQVGFTYHPQAGAEVLVAAVNGDPDHVVVINAADRRYRITGIASGELAIHDDQGQKVHFMRNQVRIETTKRVVAIAPSVLVGADDPGLPRVMTEAGLSSVLRAKV